MRFAALMFVSLAAATCLFHMAMIFGAPFGVLTMGGGWPGALPPLVRLLPTASMLLLILMSVIVLRAARLIGPPPKRWPMWVVLAFSILAVIANAATPSVWERAIWLPVTLVMLACVVRVAWRSRKRGIPSPG